ncbi:MAG: DUF2478 domain-containing protein [Bacteroidetes bacterium]|nr:DUF2478 domain-containing protein [Bacteroidota bacterium]MBU1717848.1 DUF2478 domain-containing protein [Bacteroidota bacterium]
MMEQSKGHGTVWLKAAVTGSLWGAIEVIMGSFLHNLGIPMAGTILASFGVAVMVASGVLWNERGLFWRAGLICALMKSISPSAVILGPMIGITMEAFLMEGSVRLFGRNLLGYVVGGILAVQSVLLYKVLFLLASYGLSIIDILKNLYAFAAKQLSLTSYSPQVLLGILLGVYAAIGVVAAIIGFVAGKRSLKTPAGKESSVTDVSGKPLIKRELKIDYSVWLLFLHLAAVVGGIYMINGTEWYIGALYVLLYVGFCIFKYRSALSRLKKPVIWIQIFVITMLAGFFVAKTAGSGISIEGLIVGIKLNLRAMLVVLAFSSIGVELRSPLIRSFFSGKRISMLYFSAEAGFSALPAVIEGISRPAAFFRAPLASLTDMVGRSEGLYASIAGNSSIPLYIISGSKGEGKTTFVAALAEELRKKGLRVGGILSLGFWENNERSGFEIQSLLTGEKMKLAGTKPVDGWAFFGRFYFNPEAIEFGKAELNKLLRETVDVVIIDEVGPWELKGGGWADALDKLTNEFQGTMVWTIRRNLDPIVLLRWKFTRFQLVDCLKANKANIANQIFNEK